MTSASQLVGSMYPLVTPTVLLNFGILEWYKSFSASTLAKQALTAPPLIKTPKVLRLGVLTQ